MSNFKRSKAVDSAPCWLRYVLSYSYITSGRGYFYSASIPFPI
ncbi:unnamed protein product [Acanthoscelides obtectus]|uniref:Uncharacterized protein n=1 Tax=Acanthoscelides obtectus TaxID=200917 RepID=A0A9P0L353_ACAOB|nr:unnamed protein product [Acanthoscelides obtectus]CAK1677632.1 hypothetical protein AOBTE_LOCUS31445 [Acanthoscelides obtectus]